MKLIAGLIVMAGCSLSASALAQSSSAVASSPTLGEWMNTVELFVSMPVEADGAFLFSPATAVVVEVDPGKILDNTAYGFQGMYALQKDQLGFMFEAFNLNVDGAEDTTQGVLVNGQPLESTATVGTALDMSGWALTLAGTYQVNTAPLRPIHLYAGVRYLDLTNDFEWQVTNNATFPPDVMSGRGKDEVQTYDAIVGIRGQAILRNGWFVPYGAEAGMGDSDVTWQAYLGAGYRYKWGEVSARYRYLSYQFQEGDFALEEFKLGDALLGVTIKF